jgi:hypothetical protein
MAEYPYLPNTAQFKKLVKRIPSVGVPDKVTTKWLESQGFKSKNDRPIIGILNTLGFLDAGHGPTQRWKDYRDRGKAGIVMATALRETYAELFSMYPDAHRKDDEALLNFFRANTDVGAKVHSLMVRMFKQLVELAEFNDGAEQVQEHRQAPEASSSGPELQQVRSDSKNHGFALNLNMELHLPATDDAKVYDELFAALKKHILNPETEQ